MSDFKKRIITMVLKDYAYEEDGKMIINLADAKMIALDILIELQAHE